jgi:hypothetical protein
MTECRHTPKKSVWLNTHKSGSSEAREHVKKAPRLRARFWFCQRIGIVGLPIGNKEKKKKQFFQHSIKKQKETQNFEYSSLEPVPGRFSQTVPAVARVPCKKRAKKNNLLSTRSTN